MPSGRPRERSATRRSCRTTTAWEEAGIVPREVWTAAGQRRAARLHDAARSTAVAASATSGSTPSSSRRLTRARASGVGFAIHTDINSAYLLDYATDEQKARWLPGFCSGETITAIAMTEPGAGSDLQGIQTTARRDGDHYVLNGAEDVHLQRHPGRPRHRRREDRPRGGCAGHLAAGGRARDARASSGAATWTRSASRRRTPPSCSSTTSGSRSRICSARRARASST